MAPQFKGKVPTKGSKQIFAENAATIDFYRNMAIGSTLIHLIGTLICFSDILSNVSLFMNMMAVFLYVGCCAFMKYISRPCFADVKHTVLIDPGLDLNMEGGMGEHVKDIIILTAITHILAIFTNYFWLLLLLLPARVCCLVWKHLLGPWFFEEAQEDTEQEEKKRKKMERKMNRANNVIVSGISNAAIEFDRNDS